MWTGNCENGNGIVRVDSDQTPKVRVFPPCCRPVRMSHQARLGQMDRTHHWYGVEGTN